MLQKIKFHIAGDDIPLEDVKDSISEIPEVIYTKNAVASIELDVLLASAQDINDLMFKLSRLQELFEPAGESGILFTDGSSMYISGKCACSCTTHSKATE